MSEGAAGGGFAELLRELKDRSGLSYGTLAKRLHMSTSTLHRYCNGDAVPTDYAPVERLARLCKATPEELVELHRRWVLADALRGRKAEAVAAPPTVDEDREEEAGEGEAGLAVTEGTVPDVRRRRRTAVVTGIAVAAVLGAVTLAVALPSGGSDDGHDSPVAAASAQDRAGAGGEPSTTAPGAHTSHPTSPTASASRSTAASGASPAASTPAAGGDEPKAQGAATDPVPLTVTTRPYTWETPCDQHYLIDREPGRVAPPPGEGDAAAWVAAHGAVSAGEQYVTLTVQGTGKATVVIDRLTVVSVTRRSPLAWNDYAMGYPGVGCGGSVPTRSFTVALDALRPAVAPVAGHRDFPFKVSESDPEVFYIKADASAYDVSWTLVLNWSSGSRHGTLRIDDQGRPFRTSGNNGRPVYEFPLGGSAWRAAD
ncbi:helix-turn-helix domain-containing protein [Streptomyces sp. NPDC051636]|uniref:helix-turn-helix domain-containing protein n=1 Tax=Streptomyces sp. NPDC051636 TaxID=3365663 RepID=UPI003787A409